MNDPDDTQSPGSNADPASADETATDNQTSSSRRGFEEFSEAFREALRNGRGDAKEFAEKAIPATKDFFGQGFYEIAYGVAYAAAFSGEILKEVTPENLKSGFENGREAGREAASDAVEKFKARAEAADQEPVPATATTDPQEG